tara:strand:+ start:1025 stop:1663 length:639 start_codon:yes stop_codon:yes gene_type:complete
MKSNSLKLAKTSISDFHKSLMTYYDLCKIKQKEHVGFSAKKVGRITIPEFTIPKEHVEDRTILRDKKWGSKSKWRDYMQSQGYNKHNTIMQMVDHDKMPTPLMDVLLKLPIKYPVFSLNIQPPGATVPAHEDTWRIWYDKNPALAEKYTFADTCFYIVFITKQDTGHTFSAGTMSLTWEPGDVIEMPHYTNHATANSSFTPKMLVQCLGIKK